jgi:hypothetical protein
MSSTLWSVLRSMGSLVLGFLTYLVLCGAFDFLMLVVMQGLPPRDPTKAELPHLMFVYSVANVVAASFWAFGAGYVTAWVARRRELLHASVLAGITTVMGAIAAVKESDFQPPLATWYLVALPVIPFILIPAGGWLRQNHVKTRGIPEK